MKIANKNASRYVSDLLKFEGSNTFSEWDGEVYIVYSYGYHFPMFVYINGNWYENSDKYSVSTSKQQTQCRPSATIKAELTTEELKFLIELRK